MKIGLFITARLGSSRLKAKHLQEISGAPALALLVRRVHQTFVRQINSGEAVLAIVTGARGENSHLEMINNNATVFYGDSNNVPLRHSQAASFFGVQAIVSIDGDDLLCSPDAMEKVYNCLAGGNGYVKTDGLPLGMNSWGYSVDALNTALSSQSASTLETGWGRIFDMLPLVKIEFPGFKCSQIRATLDYQEDLDFFRAVVEMIPSWCNLSDNELIGEILRQEIFRTNQCRQEEYWENFNKDLQKEKGKS